MLAAHALPGQFSFCSMRVKRVKSSFSDYDLNDTGIGGAKKKRLENRAAFIEHSLYLSLPVVVQLLHGLTAVNEGGD